MGEQAELFTDEEKVILGEKEPEPPKGPDPLPPEGGELKPPEGEKTEQKTEVKEEATDEEKRAAEALGLRIDKNYIIDDDGTKIPAKRWKSMYRDFQEEKRVNADTTRKFNLFRELGAEKFYELYPDEKPADFKPAVKELKEPPTAAMPALGTMIIQGGIHDGKTLNEVWQEDPAFASYLQTQYLNAEREKTETERQTQERYRQESENEVNAFAGQLSKDLFGKDRDKLTPQEEIKVDGAIQAVLDWMAKTKRGGGVIADAHFLMNQEKILADAKAKGGKEALESLRKPGIPSVHTGGGTATAPFSAFEEMSPDQLAEAVEKMSESGYSKFMKEASASLKSKHPGLPWS